MAASHTRRDGFSPAVTAFLVLAALPAFSCPYSIRDSGFIVRDPALYRLVVWGCGDGCEAITRWLEIPGRTYLAGANVKAEVLDPKSASLPPELAKAAEAAVASPEESGVLVSPAGTRIQLSPRPESDSQALYNNMVRATVSSPLREEILAHLIDDWCVLVLVESRDAGENARVAKVVESATRAIVGHVSEMSQRVNHAPHIIKIPWTAGLTVERIAFGALGLKGEQEPEVAILFGRGRRLGPVLAGGRISGPALDGLFKLLGKNCTCTADPSSILGPTLPLQWTQALQQKAREALGFDPDSPVAANALAGVWTTLGKPPGEAGEFLPDPGTGYIEFSVEPPDEENLEGEPQAPQEDFDDAGASLERKSLDTVLAVAAGVGAVALGGSAAILLRRMRRA